MIRIDRTSRTFKYRNIEGSMSPEGIVVWNGFSSSFGGVGAKIVLDDEFDKELDELIRRMSKVKQKARR
jgi:hypothetical protein